MGERSEAMEEESASSETEVLPLGDIISKQSLYATHNTDLTFSIYYYVWTRSLRLPRSKDRVYVG